MTKNVKLSATKLTRRYTGPGQHRRSHARFSGRNLRKERIMKTNKFGLLSAAGLASVFAVASPALAHDGHWDGRHFYPGHRVIVRPVFAPAPVVVYRPYPVYYAPAPVVYAPAP